MPCTMSGYGHKTKVAMRFEYSNSPLFRAVATFSDETQFKLKQAKSIDYARIWPEERGFGEPKELYKCNTFYSLCKVHQTNPFPSTKLTHCAENGGAITKVPEE